MTTILLKSPRKSEIEEVEDWELLAEMQKAMKSGFADTNSVLKKMGIKANAG